MENQIKAKRLGPITTRRKSPSEKPEITIEIINDLSKPQVVRISPQLAARLELPAVRNDYQSNFILFLDKDGVGVDYDREPKNTNLPVTETEQRDQYEDRSRLILKKNATGTVTIFKNLGGNIDAPTARRMVELVQAQVDNNDLKAYDILDETMIVDDIRENGRFIHIVPVS